jgi:hypothetical protein
MGSTTEQIVETAIQKAFEFGGTEEGGYILTDEELREIIIGAITRNPCDFVTGQVLKCVAIPDRHDGYFTVGREYTVVSVDLNDDELPLKMTCDTTITLHCEAEAFVAS